YSTSYPVSLDAPNSPFTTVGSWLVTTLWIEGTRGLTPQEGLAEFTLDYSNGLNVDSSDTEKVQVLGVAQLEWLARSNGFSDPTHDAPTLDEDPNAPTLVLPSGRQIENLRVVTGARATAPTVARDTVDLEVQLSQPPVRAIDLYARAFDLDDPSGDADI